jgi:hypothetical protein
MEMTVKEFCEKYRVSGWYASDVTLLAENGESKVIAYATIDALPKSMRSEYWLEEPRMSLFVFRSPRKVRGMINGKEVEARKVLAAIKELKVTKEMSIEAEKLVLMGEM